MKDAFLRRRGTTADMIRRPDSSSDRTRRRLRLTGWLVLPALLLLATGCGGGSGKKQNASAAVDNSEPAQEEEKAAPAAEEEAAPVVKRKGKFKLAEKPATPEPPAPSNKKDVSKWDMTDLNAALARRDLWFAPAVVLFSARDPNDSKRAEDLDALVRRVAKLKDDPPPIPLALPPSTLAASGSPPHAAAADTPAQPAPGAVPAMKRPKFNFGIGRKEDK
jgi:hypothetical protein